MSSHGFFWRSYLFPALALALVLAAWRSYGWQGVLLATLMLSFWVLLHFTKILRLLRTAATRPLGHCRDCRALARALKRGMPMHRVVQFTHALGLRQDSADPAADHFVWRDPQDWQLEVVLRHGRVSAWTLQPPAEAVSDTAAQS